MSTTTGLPGERQWLRRIGATAVLKVVASMAMVSAIYVTVVSPGLAAGGVRVVSNYRLGDDLHPVRGHDLPVIKADPADPRHVVEFDFDYVNESCDASVSFDAGATWAGSVLSGPAGFKAPYCHINNNHRGGRPAHSSIAFGAGANVYTTFASESADEADSIGVLHSSDGGRSFTPSVVAIPAVAPDPASPGTDFRRPQLAVSANPAGDKVYVAGWNCTLSSAAPPANHRPARCASVAFTSSSDSGKTFSAATTVNVPDPLDVNFDNSQPVVVANTLSIAYRHDHRNNPEEPDPNKARFDSSLVLGTSGDGGATWSTSVIRSAFTPARGFVDPVLAADPSDGALYLTYEEKVDQAGQAPNTLSIADIFVQRSADGGRTWSAPTRVNDDPLGAKINHWEPWLSVGADGRVDVTWFDQRNAYPGASLQDVYYASSPGKGAPFSANRRITDRSNNRELGYTNGLGTFPPVNTPVDGGVLVAWGETREANFDTNNQDVYLARLDLLSTENPPVRTLAATKLSVSMSQLAYPGGADYVGTRTVTKVVVVNEADGPAALAAAVLARANYGPVLTSPAAKLPKGVSDEIARLKPIGAYVIGNESRLSAGVASTLGDRLGKGPVDRLAGNDAADTARLIAQAMDSRSDADKAAAKPAFPAAVVVNPTTRDAAGAAEVAASLRLPLLFSDATAIPGATTDALKALGIPKTIVVGTTASISDAAMASLPGVERATPTELTAKAGAIAGVAPVHQPTNVVYVADTEHPVEAAVLAAAASRLGGTLVVAPGGTAAAATKTLTNQMSSVDRMVVVGHSGSTSWPWPLLIIVGLLAVVGLTLLTLAQRRPAQPVVSRTHA